MKAYVMLKNGIVSAEIEMWLRGNWKYIDTVGDAVGRLHSAAGRSRSEAAADAPRPAGGHGRPEPASWTRRAGAQGQAIELSLERVTGGEKFPSLRREGN